MRAYLGKEFNSYGPYASKNALKNPTYLANLAIRVTVEF